MLPPERTGDQSNKNMAVVKSNSSSVYFTNTSNSKHGVKREKLSFTNIDISLILLSMATVFIDLITDIILVGTYFLAGQTFWALCTIALAVIPAIVVQAFSIRWHLLDGSTSRAHWLTHCCLLGVFFRYVEVLRTGLEARQSGDVADFQLLFHQQSDICMLHLFESFLESAPQLVLQLYIMAEVHDWGPWTGISATASLVSLAWAIAAYTRATRRTKPDKETVAWFGFVLQAVWRAGLLAARVTALVLFAICCQAWLFLLLGLHWLGMTVWVVLQKTDLCSTPWEEYAYNCVVGVVYCFCFFNLREGRARGRMLAFYVVTVTQNLACLYLFLALAQHTHPALATFGAGTIVGGTVIGLSAMLLYYRFFHSAGPIVLFGPPSQPNQGNIQTASTAEQTEHQVAPSRPQAITHVQPQPETSVQTQMQILTQVSVLMPSDNEKTNSLRSLKHLWSIDRDGSLSSRSDDIPIHGGSPQSDDGCTDKRMLLSSCGSSRRPIPAFPSSASLSAENVLTPQTLQLDHSNVGSQIVSSASNHNLRSSQCNITNQLGTPNHTNRTTTSSQPNQLGFSNPTTRSALSLQSNHSNHSAHSSHTTRSTLSAQSRCGPSTHTSQVEHGESQSPPCTSDIDDSKLSWNCTSMMDDTQHSDMNDSPPVDDSGGGSGFNKRRGICSSIELGLDKLEEDESGSHSQPHDDTKNGNADDSFARLCQQLVNDAEVKQLGSINISSKRDVALKLRDERTLRDKEEKRESDYIDSKQSAISSDGTPSEVLSAHDYENICAVNIAREAWGLRSWRGYSDIETWLHDDSVVRDRRRDTLVSIGTTTTVTSASSERSTASESPPMARHQWETFASSNAPPLPCRRPRPSYNRMDDYLDTLAYDLAEIERRESTNRAVESQDNVFVAQPYVVDQHGMLYPLPTPLDTILEELEESSATASTVTGTDTGSISATPAWASSLVATIDEIRMGTSLCNTLDDTLAASESDFEVGSYRSLQLDSTIAQHFPCQVSPADKSAAQLRFSHSLPSLLQAPHSWSHLTAEEVLFLSKLKPQAEDVPDCNLEHPTCSVPPIFTNEGTSKKTGNRPHRKFSVLREKFEMESENSTESKWCDRDISPLSDGEVCSDVGKIGERSTPHEDVLCGGIGQDKSKSLIRTGIGEWNDFTQLQNECNSQVNPFKESDIPTASWTMSEEAKSYQGHGLLKQVLTTPKFVPRTKKLALASNASA